MKTNSLLIAFVLFAALLLFRSILRAQADSRLIALPAFPLLHGNFEVYRLFLRGAMNQLKLSARAYHRILKIARTIADLAGSEEIQSPYLVEALQYLLKADDGVI